MGKRKSGGIKRRKLCDICKKVTKHNQKWECINCNTQKERQIKMSKRLNVRLEFSSIFHDWRWLTVITITGTRIRKKDFKRKFEKFISGLR